MRSEKARTTRISEMTTDEMIGQLLFIGIPGPEADDTTEKLLEEIRPGGVCLFARNIREPEQTRSLLDSIRERTAIEPLLSVDQEGGLVDRLKRIFSPMPAADTLRKPDDAAKLAKITAEVLLLLGFNMNFAPVVDVTDDDRRKFSNGLYSRTYGNSAEDAAEFGFRYLHELQSNGCIGCAKHFPGLGAAQVDSHNDLPEVVTGLDHFDRNDLYPYRRLIASGEVLAIMAAHAVFPGLNLQAAGQNGKLLPSSLDHAIVTQLLRQGLGFNGVVITDDLEMGAIVKNFGIGEASVLAVLAGADMLAICAGVDSIYEGKAALSDAVRTGRISRDRLTDSVTRIIDLKGRAAEPPPFDIQRFSELAENNRELREHILSS